MFHSMNNNSYPLFFNQSPSFNNTSLETNNIPFHQHSQEIYNNYLTPSNFIIPQISENPINNVLVEANPINLGNTIKNPSMSSKRVADKRDRHTKICTAQGVRDRRVRLSINIARDFFNLQDMLGFDKASKTLGWLMEKSKDAIKELTSTTNYNKTNYEEHNKDVCKNATTSKKRRKPRENYNDKSVVNAIRRSSRVKARERARERTKNKKTNQNQRNYAHLESSSHRHQHDNDDDDDDGDQHGVEQDLMFHESISAPNLIPYGISKSVLVGESVVLKSKSRDSCHNNSYDMITKDYEMGYNNYYLNDQNNDGMIQTPGLSALNIINFSAEIHINAKPWDIYNNQNLN